MSELIDIFDEERTCEFKGEVYSVRDNGSVMRHNKEGKKPRPLDNKWTFGKLDTQHGYLTIGLVAVHRIVATAFLGGQPSDKHVVDHIDTNRQNNRPSNLRWLTRLENIVLNDITRSKLEQLCGCPIDEILSDLSILRNIPLTPQFEWIRAVSKQEAEQSLITWKKWVNWLSENKEKKRNTLLADEYKNKRNSPIRSSNPNGVNEPLGAYYDRLNKWVDKASERKEHEIPAEYRNGRNGFIYPLEPQGAEASLDAYYHSLKTDEVFCYKDYPSGRYSFYIIDFCLNKETNILSVATTNHSEVKPLYLTGVTLSNDGFEYDTQSFFTGEGLSKYMTLARGEEWTGGDVFDDYC